MKKPPLIRRILPWIFFAIFIVVAPILILYTAGYRYNLQKGQLERNGTLIVDSTPSGASVIIDDVQTGDKTPVTYQNLATGWHDVRLEKSGYISWQKSFEVRPERVVFANQIRLWRTEVESPTIAITGPAVSISSDPSNLHAAILLRSATNTSIGYWIPGLAFQKTIPIVAMATDTPLTLRWSADGQSVVINGLDESSAAWWSGATSIDLPSVQQLPSALYHWSSDALLGQRDHTGFRFVPRTIALTDEVMPDQKTIDQDGLYTLEMSTSTDQEIMIDHSFWPRYFSLPIGHWRFADTQDPFVLLKDENSWLAINPHIGSDAYGGEVTGDYPRWLTTSKTPTALFLNGNEIWMWQLGNTPTLLWRQGEPIVQVTWHQSGLSIFVATQTSIFALDLDDRNGRLVTPFADFTHVYDLSVIGKSLYAAAEKNGVRGVWEMKLE